MYQRQIFFVDDSPLTADKSASERWLERSTARSHVAKLSCYRRKFRKKQQTQDAPEIDNKVLPYSCGSVDFQINPAWDQTIRTPSPTLSTVSNSSGSSYGSPLEASDMIMPQKTYAQATIKAATRNQGLSTIPRDRHGLRVDPFTDLPQEDSSFAWLVMDYFARVVVPAQTTLDEVFSVRTVYTDFVLQPIFQGDLRYAALLGFYMSLHLLLHEGETLAPDALRCAHQAISVHRTRLQQLGGRTDEIAIHTTLLLAIVAEATGDMESFRLHKKAISSVIASAGGFHQLPPTSAIRNVLLQWDFFWALGDGSAPMFAIPDPKLQASYPQHTFGPKVARLVVQLPPGFQSLASKGYLSFDVLELLARIAKNLQAPKWSAQTADNDLPRTSGLYPSYLEGSSQFNRCGNDDSSSHSPDLGKMIVLGLVLYCSHVSCQVPVPIMSYRAVRKRLSADVVRVSQDKEDWLDILLWLWMNVVDAWHKPDHKLRVQGKALLREVKLSFPGVGDEVALQKRLKLFFWNERFGMRCGRYWENCSGDE